MRAQQLCERQHGFADVVVLLAVLGIAIVTWAAFADAAVPAWKPFVSVAISWLLALAALTRHPWWAPSIRSVLAAWIVAAPHALDLTMAGPAHWALLAIGAGVAATAIPYVAPRRLAFP